MDRFIKTFVDASTADVAEAANQYASDNGLIIFSAQLCFSGAGRTYEMAVLTVIFERGEVKVRRSRKKAEDNSNEGS